MKFGSLDITDCKLGSTPIVEVRRGTELIWPDAIAGDYSPPDSYHSQTTEPYLYGHGTWISEDGLRAWHVNASTKKVYQHNLSSPFDLSTITANAVTSSITVSDAGTVALYFSPDGLLMFTGDTNSKVYKHTLSTAWDISTLTRVQTSAALNYFDMFSVHFSPDGLTMYAGAGSSGINEHILSTAWDLSTLSAETQIYAEPMYIDDLHFSSDGLRCAVVGRNDDKIKYYTLSTAYDFSSFSLLEMTDDALNDWRGCGMTEDGKRVIVVNDTHMGIFTVNI